MLFFKDVKPSDFGVYNCTASNLYGVDYSTVTLQLREGMHLKKKTLFENIIIVFTIYFFNRYHEYSRIL